MHLYVAAKGIKPHLDKWQNDLLAINLPYMKDGKQVMENKAPVYIQLSVRPMQLFEIGFPEEHLDLVLQNVGISAAGDYITKRYPSLNMIAKTFRAALKLKKVKMPEKVNALMQPYNMGKAVAVVPIGLKDDVFFEGKEQL